MRPVRRESPSRRGPRGTAAPVGRPPSARDELRSDPRDRFRSADAYRSAREWTRYEGTAQRDLFRTLRRRFLERWAVPGGWAFDVGSGPGRFTPFVGGVDARRVAADLSLAMLRQAPRTGASTPDGPYPPVDRIVADALHPPWAPGSARTVAVLGNLLGFAGRESERLLERLVELVEPGGVLLLEVAPGPGERSSYLARLPPGAVARLLRAPSDVVLSRIRREPFRREPTRHRSVGFDRWTPVRLAERLSGSDWEPLETVAVAPCLGPDADRIAAVRPDPKAWGRLLEIEERIGHEAARWTAAAAVLVAVRRAWRAHD